MRMLLLLCLMGCGSVVEVEPPSVVIEDATFTTDHSGFNVHATVRNIGGPGQYRLEFWALPNSPNGSYWLAGESDVVTISSDYEETGDWFVAGSAFPIRVDAYVRGLDQATWMRSDRVEF